jgi:predicted ferric reductase
MYVFRRYWYEFFLVVHIVLAIVFLIGTWYHLLLKDGDFMEWLMAGFGIWAFDRFVRIIRLMVLNISWRKGRVARTARLEMIGTDAIKATVSVGYNISFRPGQYVYIYFPRFNFWESHPFTIASYDVSRTSASQPTLSLLFRTRGGITRKLQKYLETGPKEMVCLVEGPYGHHVHLERYDNVLLLAGGVGITTIFAYLKHLVNMDVRRVRFVWTVRDEDSMRWFSEEIAETLKSQNIEVEIHITKSDNGGVGMEPERIVEELELKKVETGSATTNTKEVDSDANSFASHIFVGDKPDLTELITQESANCKGSLAVLACGPDTFVDEIRKAVADNVVKAKGVIDYFEEAYSW